MHVIHLMGPPSLPLVTKGGFEDISIGELLSLAEEREMRRRGREKEVCMRRNGSGRGGNQGRGLE